MMGEDLSKELVTRIVAHYEPQQILLFASSDVDLLIIKNTTLPMWRRGRNVQALFTNSPVKVDLLFYSWEEIAAERARPHSFISRVLASARVIYPRPAIG